MRIARHVAQPEKPPEPGRSTGRGRMYGIWAFWLVACLLDNACGTEDAMTVVWEVFCSHCGERSESPGERFCANCGHELSPRHNLSCPKCGRTVYAKDNFCGWCGANLHDAIPNMPGFCSTCGAQLHVDSAFCYICGAAVNEPAQSWEDGGFGMNAIGR